MRSFQSSTLCRSASPSALWAAVKLYLRSLRVSIVPLRHLPSWLVVARMAPSRARLFRLHALLLALPAAAQLSLSAIVGALGDLCSRGASYFEVAFDLARIVTRERSLAARFETALLLHPLCCDLIVNHVTLCIDAATPHELHAIAPMTRRIDLSSSAQVRS